MGYLGKGLTIKKRLRRAKSLLKEAGYITKSGMANGPAGKLEFKILAASSNVWGRIIAPYISNLSRIGVKAEFLSPESIQWIKLRNSHKFQMTPTQLRHAQIPGGEQLENWGSEAANQELSSNYAGVSNKGIDILLNKIQSTTTYDELVLYVKCLDRALYHLHPMVHLYHSKSLRIAYWNKYSRPSKLPRFYGTSDILETMWLDKDKSKKLIH